jgi:hypothetical protein
MTATNPTTPNRLIKGYLTVMALLHTAATVVLSMDYYFWFTSTDPTKPQWPFWFPATTPLANFIAVISLGGLWFWRRWGFVSYLVVTVVSFLISLLVLRVPVSELVPSLVGIGIFSAIFIPRLKEMS